MPSFTRGNETEISYRKEVEDLMKVLSKSQINVPNKVLQRAIVIPKDPDGTNTTYPKVKDLLMHNPFGTE